MHVWQHDKIIEHKETHDAVLSLTQEELSDPRIEGAVEEIMEEFAYGRA